MTGAPGTAGSGGPFGLQHPFRLPSGTSLRFALLILSTSVAISEALGNTITTAAWFLFRGGSLDSLIDTLDCAPSAFAEFGTDPDAFTRRCQASVSAPGAGAALNLALIVVLWLGVGVTLWLLPAYRLRRRRLRPFRPGAHPEIRRTLDALVQVAELPCAVRFVVDWRDQRLTGLAFGRVGRRHVLLSRGLLQLHRSDPEAFREIVLHELAHLRNRDVDIAFVTLVCQRLFVYAIAVPMAVLTPGAVLVSLVLLPGGAIFQLMVAVTQGALAITVACASAAVLRSRELHADARVALWTGGAPALRQLLRSQQASEQYRPRRPPHRRTHPSAAERLAALANPALLFRFSAWEAFGLALSGSLVHLKAAQWTTAAVGLGSDDVLGAAFAATALGGSLGAGIWRTTLAAHLDRTAWPGAHRTGLAVGGGLALGACMDERHFTALAMGVADPLPVQSSWWLLLGVVGYGFVRWNAALARTWAPLVLAARRPLLPIAVSTAAGAVLLALWLGSVYPLGTPGFGLLPLPRPLNLLPTPLDHLGYAFSVVAVVPPPPVVLAVVAATAALPLAAPFGRRILRRARTGPGPERFLLRPPPPDLAAALVVVVRQAPLRAVGHGIALGAAAGAALWLAHVVSAAVFPLPIEWLGSEISLYFVPVAMLLQLAVGLVAARLAPDRDLRALHGVLAALGAGLVLPVAAMTARDHFACVRWGTAHPACTWNPLAEVGFETPVIMAWAAALALLVLPAVTALADGVRRRR
ncbi:M48 family metalloprotease [Kitasatospora sp. NPDC059646]|uniref:M48 family metalloprotease n=1 Tax=Kitasatospora sp. NPDC059646 TaxID=3346893 RepID=UPI00367DF33E